MMKAPIPQKQKKRKLRNGLIITLVVLIISALGLHFVGKRLGYANGWDFVSSFGSHYSRGISADYQTIDIDISKQDYKKLKDIRNRAMKFGMQQDEEDRWVKGILTQNGKEVKIKLRLKGHMTDHLEGKKWSFRIKTRKGTAWKGMHIFSLQHPGTRSYAYEWIFHEILRREGIIALRYDFINVNLNGENLGIYAMEENFAEELTENNHRPKGPIVRFNPDMYWIFRRNELKGMSFLHEGGAWQSSRVEPYDDNDILGDSSTMELYTTAMGLLEGLRTGKYKPSQIFDIEKMAIYHAWIDVIGGQHSLDWTDVKYYYNPVTRVLEPVAYESFSAYPVYSLSGAFRYSSDTSNFTDLHTLIYSDTVFFAEYMRQLNRMSNPAWIKKSLAAIDKKLQQKLDVLYSEWPHRNFTTDIYVSNANAIQKMLVMPVHINAFYDGSSNDSMYFRLGGIDGLPVLVKEVIIDGKSFALNQPWLVSPKERNKPVKYVRYGFKPDDSTAKKLDLKQKITFTTSVPGLTTTGSSVMYNRYWTEKIEMPVSMSKKELQALGFVVVNESAKEILVQSGKHILNKYVVLPEGYALRIGPGTTIDFVQGAGVVAKGDVEITGSAEENVYFTSSDHSGKGILAVGTGKTNVEISDCSISGMNARSALAFYACKFTLQKVSIFDNRENGIEVARSPGHVKNSIVSACGKNGLVTQYGAVIIENCKIEFCKSAGIKSVGAQVVMKQCYVHETNTALKAELFAEMKATDCQLSKSKTGINAKNGASIIFSGGTISDAGTAADTDHDKDTYGVENVQLIKTKTERVKQVHKPNAKVTLVK